ncbi:hypothetical protein, partial [Micromonospora sp. NPDC050276]|uniref:hypothetical protein n=1 Tax=Micromonospora sp. NPDC050276 TaxID=3364278 RepID=UPI0037A38B82
MGQRLHDHGVDMLDEVADNPGNLDLNTEYLNVPNGPRDQRPLLLPPLIVDSAAHSSLADHLPIGLIGRRSAPTARSRDAVACVVPRSGPRKHPLTGRFDLVCLRLAAFGPPNARPAERPTHGLSTL